MKINKHIYADISEKVVESQIKPYQTFFAYKVNLITEYDIVLFGKVFHKTKTKEIPFLFKTLDMAKDFCEIKPKYEKVCFQNSEDGFGFSVKFYTYQLVVNKKIIGYLWWHKQTICIDEKHSEFKFNSNSIIDGFVKNINVQSWIKTHYLSDIKYHGFTDKLTDLVMPINNDTGKHWRFELIENK